MIEEVNNFLNDVMGNCDRGEGTFISSGYLCCVKCNQIIDKGMTPCTGPVDFFDWNGFGKLITWARTQEWWDDFVYDNLHTDYGHADPEKFAVVLYDYLIYKK